MHATHTSVVPCILATHGSFNPVHLHHVSMLAQAKAHLEQHGYDVKAGYLAPTCVSHIMSKGARCINDAARLDALRLACAPHAGWLRVEPAGVEFNSGKTLLERKILPEWRLSVPEVIGIDVIGEDVALRYPSNLRRRPVVVVTRGGASTELNRQIEETGSVDQVIVLSKLGEEDTDPFSSTAVRRALASEDQTAVREMCGEAVAALLFERQAEGTLWAAEEVEEEDGAPADASVRAAPSRKRRADDASLNDTEGVGGAESVGLCRPRKSRRTSKEGLRVVFSDLVDEIEPDDGIAGP